MAAYAITRELDASLEDSVVRITASLAELAGNPELEPLAVEARERIQKAVTRA